MLRSLKTDVKLKDGTVYTKGETVAVNFLGDTDIGYKICEIKILGSSFKLAIRKLPMVVTGFKKPSMNTLEKWSNDGICKTPTGQTTEPDGYGEDGSPSWLLALGYM